MTTNQYLNEFYNHYDEDSRLKVKQGSIEFLTTMRYIEKYLKPNAHTLAEENTTVRQGNALDLSDITDNQYDITLLLGLLYHLYNKEDKMQAIKEAIRVTKQDRVIFCAYVISDGCLIDEGSNRGKQVC